MSIVQGKKTAGGGLLPQEPSDLMPNRIGRQAALPKALEKEGDLTIRGKVCLAVHARVLKFAVAA
jgi:hypothetical protein